MSNKIGANDFFEDGFEKDLERKLQAFKKLQEGFEEAIKLMVSGAEKMKKVNNSGGKSNLDTAQVQAYRKELIKLQNTYQSLLVSIGKHTDEIAKNKVQTQRNNALTKVNAEIALSAAGSYDYYAARLKKAKIMMKQVESAMGSGSAEFKKYQAEAKKFNQILADMDKGMGQYTRNVGNYKSALGGLGSTLKRLASVYLGFEAFRSAVRTTRDLTVKTDSLRLAYRQIIPNAAKLAKTNIFLEKTAENYGIDLLSLSKNYLRFTAASKSTNLSMEETQQIFDSVAKAGAVMGLEAVRMDRAFNALEQMLSKGKVSSEELRQQLGDSLPGSMEIMAQALGKTTLELSKMLEEGTVLSDVALPKFAAQLEKTYGIENLNRVENLAASQGRLRNAVIELVDAMQTTGTFRDFYTAMADGVKFIARNVYAIKNLIKSIAALGIAYAGLNFGAFISSIRLTRIGMLRLIATIKQAVVATQAWNLALRLNSLGALITAITTAIGLFVLFNKRTTESQVILGKLTEMQRDLNEEIQEAIKKNSELEESKRKSVESIKDEITQKKVLNWEEEYGLELKREQIKLEAFYQKMKEGFYGDKFEQGIILEQIETSRKRVRFLKEQLNFAKLLTPSINKAISATMRLFAPLAKPLFTVTPKVASGGGEPSDPKFTEMDKWEAKIKAMKEGKEKELETLKFLQAKEDAALEKMELDTTINDEKWEEKRLEITKKYAKLKLDALMKFVELAKKIADEQLEADKVSVQKAWNIIDEKKRILDASVDAFAGEGYTGNDLKLFQLSVELEHLNNIKESADDLKLTELERYENLQKINSEQAKFWQLFHKTPMGQKMFGVTNNKKPEDGEKDDEGLFGMSAADSQAVTTAWSHMTDAVSNYYNTAIQLSQQLLQQRRQEVNSAERELQREMDARNAGYANFVDDAQKRLNFAKAAEEKERKRQKKLQKEKLIADTAVQASNLATGISAILGAHGLTPWLAAPLIALMLGTFAVSKAKAFAFASEDFAEGDLSIIGGGRHGSKKNGQRNDTLVGFSGNKAQFAEQGEARMILSRRATAKYKDILPSLFDQLSSGTFNSESLTSMNGTITTPVIVNSTDMSATNNELRRIRKQGELKVLESNGKRYEIRGNKTRIIHK